MTYTCNINNFLLSFIVILLVTFTDNIFKNVPVLKKLFTDSLNYILLISLVILVLLIDISSGIILAFAVLYLSVYINNKKGKFTDIKQLSNNLNKSESEFIYNNTKPFPNKNIKPFEPITQEEINKISNEIEPIGCGLKTSTNPEYITQIGMPSRDGYDITGCRYDFKNSPQNLTKYGPPLAQCATYSGEQARTCGTVFYPLNA